MINIVNKRARQLYLAEMTRMMTRLENIQARQLKPILNKQYLNAASLVRQGVLDAVDHVVSQERARLSILFLKHYRRVATTFSNKTYKVIEDSKKFINVPDIKGPKDEFWAELNRWTRKETASKVTGIQRTSRKLLAKTIQKGMNEGLSNHAIAKNLVKNGRISTPFRAKTIAITETHTAAVKSVDAAIRSTRIEMEKEWIANIDKRTRPAHVDADGQKVAQDGMFIVDGIAMAYPGDPKGGANNTVRCRCVLMYHTVKRMDKLKPYKPEEGVLGDITPGMPAKSADDILKHYKKSEKATFIEGKSASELKADIADRLGNKMYALKSDNMDDFIRPLSNRIATQDMVLTDYKVASENIIRQWAATSGDTNPHSIAMQLAAQKEFGLKGTSLWWEKEALAEAKILFKKHEIPMRKFLREMYNDTQKHLAKRGLKTVRVARGYKGDIGIEPSTIANKMSITKIQLQPMSSFSSNFGEARLFAREAPGSLFYAEIPAERILSCPVTGFGCKKEFEYVVLGSQKIKGEKILASMLTKKQPETWNTIFGMAGSEGDRKITAEIFKRTSKVKIPIPKPQLPRPRFVPASSVKEAEKRFNNVGVNYISKPGKGTNTWAKENAYLKNALNPTLEEIERVKREFPKLGKALKEEGNNIWDVKFYRGRHLPKYETGERAGILADYSRLRAIRIAITDTAGASKPSLSIGKRTLTVGKDFRASLRHEMGHHYFDVIARKEKQRFMQIWRDSGRNDYFKKKVSIYSGTNIDEAFAECFAAKTSPLHKGKKVLPKIIDDFLEKALR